MDIYAYAKEMDYMVDYLDPHSGLIYKIQDYGKALKFGLPTPGIAVVDEDGNMLGYAQKKKEEA